MLAARLVFGRPAADDRDAQGDRLLDLHGGWFGADLHVVFADDVAEVGRPIRDRRLDGRLLSERAECHKSNMPNTKMMRITSPLW